MTIILHCHWWEFWSRDTDVIILSILYLLKIKMIWDIVVFRLVVFVANNIFKPTIFMHNFIYVDFRINLTQFYINSSRQGQQIEL